MSLKDEGFRWIYRESMQFQYAWIHPTEVREGDTDCTDMSDSEFADFVEAHPVRWME